MSFVNLHKDDYRQKSINKHKKWIPIFTVTYVTYMDMIVSHEPVTTMDSTCRSSFAQFARSSLAIFHERANTRGAARRGAASCRGIFSTAEPTDDHAVCIFPFRRYEVCGMILYAKSSLELIVNNRIGKVGIRPDGRPSSTPHHRRHHPAAHRPLCPPTIR